MNTPPLRRWKLKERDYNQRYKLNIIKKTSQPCDLSGKFLFLLSKSDLCIIVKFITKNVCVTVGVISIDTALVKQISRKYVLSTKKYKKLLAQSEVRITENFEDCFRKIFKNGTEISEESSQQSNSEKVTPIKIVSCKICKLKLVCSELEDHLNLHTAHNDNKLAVSNTLHKKQYQCYRCFENFSTETSLSIHIENAHEMKTSDIKKTSAPKNNFITFMRFDSSSKKEFICRICSTKYEERIYLDRHIASFHITIVFKCYRCNVPFDKTYSLLKHLKHAHVKYNNEKGFIETIQNPDRLGSFHCCFCRYSSKNRSKVEVHLIDEHYEDFEKNLDFPDEPNSSSPDSLDELMLAETKCKLNENFNSNTDEDELLTELVHKNNTDDQKRKPANHPSFRYRCVRCLRRFSRSNWLKRHSCVSSPRRNSITPVSLPKKRHISNEVNGFLKCVHTKCTKVFTDRNLFDQHLKQH